MGRPERLDLRWYPETEEERERRRYRLCWLDGLLGMIEETILRDGGPTRRPPHRLIVRYRWFTGDLDTELQTCGALIDAVFRAQEPCILRVIPPKRKRRPPQPPPPPSSSGEREA